MGKQKDLTKPMLLEMSTCLLFYRICGRRSIRKYSIKKLPPFAWESKIIGRINALKIDVRSSEKGHNLPHFHVVAPGKVDAVYSISPLKCIKGEPSSKINKAILKWALQNYDLLKDEWNRANGYRIRVE